MELASVRDHGSKRARPTLCGVRRVHIYTYIQTHTHTHMYGYVCADVIFINIYNIIRGAYTFCVGIWIWYMVYMGTERDRIQRTRD